MRPVHYAAHGGGGLAFHCYYDELKRHLAVRRKHEDAHPYKDADSYIATGKLVIRLTAKEAPPPRCHTDLRRVTCLTCLREISRLVNVRIPVVVKARTARAGAIE